MFSCVRFCMRFCACTYLCCIGIKGLCNSFALSETNLFSTQKSVLLSKVHPGLEVTSAEERSMEEALQESLNGETVFLRYSYEYQNRELRIFISNHLESEELVVAVNPGFLTTIDGFSNLLKQNSLARASKRLKFIETSHLIYNVLISPIIRFLEHKNRLIIVGDGVLQKIPFELLLAYDADKPYSNLNFLIRDFAVSYHFSTASYLESLDKESSFDLDLLAFAPVFEDGPATFASNDAYREGGDLNALPYSKIEVQDIQTLFQRKRMSKTKMLLDNQATEDALKNNFRLIAKFIHIASHSFADLYNPAQSGIFCVDKKGANFGILSSGEIKKLSINADLVVLSSCDSGTENNDGQKEAQGIHRSFVEAGAANVVFSNWKVNDKVCKEFMIMFYEAILNGMTYADAMQQAKLKLINNPATACPNYWSAFSLIGR